MLTQNSTSSAARIRSLDGVKGFISLKIALNHAMMFYTMVPVLALVTGFGRLVSFPVLLFAFGVGNGISRRRKPAWPLLVLIGGLIFGSILAETFLKMKVANGFHTGERPMEGSLLMQLGWLLSLKRGAHFTDFLQPYIFFLGTGLIADRLGRPMRDWKPWILASIALAMAVGGNLLVHTHYHGPLSQLWEGGYRTFQYAPLFVAGLLIGAHRKQWLRAADKTPVGTALCVAGKILVVKFVSDAVELIRPHLGSHGSLWKEGDPASVIGGMIIGLLLFSAYSDAVRVFQSRILEALEKVGRRTIVSLCVQLVVIPLAGMLAVQFHDTATRAVIGLSGWLVFAVIVLNWDWIVARLPARSSVVGRPSSVGEGMPVPAES